MKESRKIYFIVGPTASGKTALSIELAKKSGNKLTQTLDAEGNLVGVNTINFDDRDVADTAGREAHEKKVITQNL